MRKPSSLDVAFIVGCISAFVALSIATALGMIRVIGWYLLNCRNESWACSTSQALIDFWWLLYVPAVVAGAFFLHRIYVRRQTSRVGPD